MVESTKQKKALKTKIEIADKLKKIQRENPEKLLDHLDKIMNEAKAELEKIEGKK